ncbi:MAG: HNH endonuclease signature motif containing protein [Cyanobacteria bacterium P01_B01_bin.77]
MSNIKEATLLKRQRGRCPICRGAFDLHDSIERDHVRPMASGGLDVYDNLQIVHPTCHHRKTRWDKQGWCPVRPWRGETLGEKPCEGFPSRTVLKAGGSS